jgi:hypothetical protein
MKKLLLLFFCITSFTVYAEDVLQVLPVKTTAGLKYSDNKVIEIYLCNTFDVANMQFDILLPDGMASRTDNKYMIYEERAQVYDEDEEDYFDLFSITTNKLSSGYTRFMFTPSGKGSIKAGQGVIMKIPYKTDASMEDGIYPILMSNIRLDKSVTETVVVESASSYVVIGDSKSPSTDAHVDMSGMTGYIPSFVVNKLNTDIASNTNLKSLNLSGTTFEKLGAELSVPTNDDLLWYTSDKASLNRTFTADKWSSVCLPVTLETSSLSGTPLIKKMDSYDTTEGYISLTDVTTMEKGKPYMVKTASNSKLFNNVAITASESVSSEPGSFTSGNLTMKGTYQYTTVSSTASTTYYGFSSGKFVGVNVGGTGRIQPFRAYLELNGAAGSRSIFLAEDGETTKIDKVIDDNQPESHLYNLQGMRMDNGCKTKGVFIRDGKKVIIK